MLENVVIITGGAQRVGLCVALDLIKAGYQVVVTYRTHRLGVEELKQNGATLVQTDFSNQDGIDNFIQWANENIQSIRGLIHNASDWQGESSTSCNNLIAERMMQIHFHTPYQLNLAFTDLMKKLDMADIIHISDYVIEKGSDKHIAYSASKAAMDNLTLSFAKLLAPSIKVNSILPSLIVFNEHDTESYKTKTLKKSVLGIEPGEAEISNAILFILNSRYMTGRQLKLDGGRHIL